MADEKEIAFVKTFVGGLSSQPVTYEDDFQPPLENYLKRVPVLPTPVPAPPERKQEEKGPVDSITITIKSVKPAQTYALSVQPTDTIADIKAQLAGVTSAPPADVQRLLVKGKVLADGKLLKEYDVKDGHTVNLMIKPGYHWDPTTAAPAEPPKESTSSASLTANETSPPSITLVPEPKQSKSRQGHGRIPSVVLSPSPSLTPLADEKLVDIPLILDTSNIPPSSAHFAPDTPYHTIISQPEFWERLYGFLSNEFPSENDAAMAWEDFFCASKGVLSVNEIAKIRDKVGVTGMAGT